VTHPPSSSDIFFNVPEQFFASILPTLVDPVKETLRMIGFVVSSSPMAWRFFSHVTTLSTPSGTPARFASYHQSRLQSRPNGKHTSMIAIFVNGVSDGTLMTAVHPTARAGPIFLAIIAAGKFHLSSATFPSLTHGTSKAQTPIGCLMTKSRVPGTEQGIVSP